MLRRNNQELLVQAGKSPLQGRTLVATGAFTDGLNTK